MNYKNINDTEEFLEELQAKFNESGKFKFKYNPPYENNCKDKDGNSINSLASDIMPDLNPIDFANIKQILKSSPMKVGKRKHMLIHNLTCKKIVDDTVENNKLSLIGQSEFLDFFLAKYLTDYISSFIADYLDSPQGKIKIENIIRGYWTTPPNDGNGGGS